jgi:hypothetical protein
VDPSSDLTGSYHHIPQVSAHFEVCHQFVGPSHRHDVPGGQETKKIVRVPDETSRCLCANSASGHSRGLSRRMIAFGDRLHGLVATRRLQTMLTRLHPSIRGGLSRPHLVNNGWLPDGFVQQSTLIYDPCRKPWRTLLGPRLQQLTLKKTRNSAPGSQQPEPAVNVPYTSHLLDHDIILIIINVI